MNVIVIKDIVSKSEKMTDTEKVSNLINAGVGSSVTAMGWAVGLGIAKFERPKMAGAIFDAGVHKGTAFKEQYLGAQTVE